MSKKSTDRPLSLKLGWVFPAFLFLFNPNINIVDILPDFLGYAMLCAAFAKVGELNEQVSEAVVGFRKMMWIDLCKWPALIWVFGLSVTTERNSSLLLWAFVFGTLELIFAIPAFLKLFDGLTQIGYLYPNESLFGRSSEKKSRTDRIRNLTVVFLAVKAVFSVLPEFADLSNSSYDETSHTVNLYQYIGVMRLLACTLVFLVGVIWLVAVLRYFATLCRDTVLQEALRTRYQNEVLPKTGMFIRRNFRAFSGMMLLTLSLTMDLRLESVNVFPDFLAATALVISLILLRKYIDRRKRSDFAACAVYFLLSAAEAVAEYFFFAHYTYSAVIRNEGAALAYGIWLAAIFLKNVAFVWCMAVVWQNVKRTVAEHTGYVAGREHDDPREQKMIESLRRELMRNGIPAMIFVGIYAVLDVCYPVLALNFGFAWLLHCVAALAAVFFFGRALFAVRNAVDTKYMLS